MEILRIISILLPYVVLLFWVINLSKKQQKLRVEFFKKLSDSETERDNLIDNLIDNLNSMVNVLNNNRKGQDKNWERCEKYIKKNDELNEVQAQINLDNLEIFQEFDYIIQGLDKKINEVSDEQEEILMRKELDTQQINIVCRELEKLTLKRDRYENRLTEVCKEVDIIKVLVDKNTKITVGNFGVVNDTFSKVQINFDKTFKGFKQIKEDFKTIESRIKRPDIEIDTEALAKDVDNLEKKVSEIDRTLNKVIQRQLQAKNLKEVLENPIEVTKPSCETKLKMKEQVNQYEVETVTEIVNKCDFEWLGHTFEKGCVFIWKNGSLEAKLRALTRNFREEFAKSLWAKVLELNEPKPKRKYTKKK